MKKTHQTLLFILISLLGVASSAQASSWCDILLSGPRATNRTMVENNYFPIGRGLRVNTDALASWPKSDSNFRWLDSGAGLGNAAREFLNLYPDSNIQIVGVSRTIHAKSFKSEKFQHFGGRFLEEIPNEELGKFDYITDFYGPFSYTEHLEVVLQKYVDLLKVGGKVQIQGLYVNGQMPPENFFSAMFKNTAFFQFYLTQKNRTISDGFKTYNVFEWLQLFEGIKVTSSGEDDLIIEKLTENPQRFPKLNLELMESGRPPLRYYRVIR